MWNINAPQGRIACAIFTKFAEFVRRFRSMDLLEGLWRYENFKLTGLVIPKFQCPLATNLYVRPPNVLKAQERARGPLSPCQVWWGSDFTRRRGGKNVQFLSVCLSVCLFACLFVTHLNVTDCAPDFAMKALEYRNSFDAVG